MRTRRAIFVSKVRDNSAPKMDLGVCWGALSRSPADFNVIWRYMSGYDLWHHICKIVVKIRALMCLNVTILIFELKVNPLPHYHQRHLHPISFFQLSYVAWSWNNIDTNINPLSINHTKWSVCLTILWDCRLKG